MYSIIKRLRDHGQLRLREDVELDMGHPGELRFAIHSSIPRAILIEVDDDQMTPLIPILEHAQLLTMRVDMMRFRGVERDKDGIGYEQEWTVKILGYS